MITLDDLLTRLLEQEKRLSVVIAAVRTAIDERDQAGKRLSERTDEALEIIFRKGITLAEIQLIH